MSVRQLEAQGRTHPSLRAGCHTQPAAGGFAAGGRGAGIPAARAGQHGQRRQRSGAWAGQQGRRSSIRSTAATAAQARQVPPPHPTAGSRGACARRGCCGTGSRPRAAPPADLKRRRSTGRWGGSCSKGLLAAGGASSQAAVAAHARGMLCRRTQPAAAESCHVALSLAAPTCSLMPPAPSPPLLPLFREPIWSTSVS